jgi:hypothetical protein
MQGQQAAQQYNQQQDDADLQRGLQLYQVQQQETDRQARMRDAELDHAMTVMPLLDPAHPLYGALQQRLTEGLLSAGQQTPGPNLSSFLSPRAQQALQRRGIAPSAFGAATRPVPSLQPSAVPGMTAAPTATPVYSDPEATAQGAGGSQAASSPVPASPFLPPGYAEAKQELQRSLDRIEASAMQQGDNETAGKARGIRQGFLNRKLTPEQALSQANELDVQGTAIGKVLANWDSAGKDLYAAIKAGQIAPENLTEANGILADIKRLGAPTNPTQRARAQTVLGRYADFLNKGGVGEDPTAAANRQYTLERVQAGADKVKADAANKAGIQNTRLMRAIEAAKGNPSRFSAEVQAQRAFATKQPAEYNIIPYGGADFDTAPQDIPSESDQTATRRETPEEVQARLQTNAAKYTEDPKQKQQYLQAGIKSLMATFNGKRWETLSPNEKAGIVDRIGALSDEAGIPNPLMTGVVGDQLSPELKARIIQQVEDRKIKQQNADTNSDRLDETVAHNLTTENAAKLRQQTLALMKTAGVKGDPVLTQRAVLLRQRIGRVEEQINKLPPGSLKKTDPLFKGWQDLLREFDEVTAQAQRNAVQGTAGMAIPSRGDGSGVPALPPVNAQTLQSSGLSGSQQDRAAYRDSLKRQGATDHEINVLTQKKYGGG